MLLADKNIRKKWVSLEPQRNTTDWGCDWGCAPRFSSRYFQSRPEEAHSALRMPAKFSSSPTDLRHALGRCHRFDPNPMRQQLSAWLGDILLVCRRRLLLLLQRQPSHPTPFEACRPHGSPTYRIADSSRRRKCVHKAEPCRHVRHRENVSQ
eukprot:SAG31_NODE_6845_length_1871_cov_2.088600_1_plen_152_part_00